MAVPARLETVAILGNGIMGHGIAQIFAVANYQVILIGRNPAKLAAALENIKASLAQFQTHELVTAAEAARALERIRVSTVLEDAADAQLVIEAVTEDLALKHEIFERLEKICPPPTVLASSSGQPASNLVAKMRQPAQVVAAHFWYPPQLIPLVELCAGPETAPDIVPWLVQLLRQVAKNLSSSIANCRVLSAIGSNSRSCVKRGRCGRAARRPPKRLTRWCVIVSGGALRLRDPSNRRMSAVWTPFSRSRLFFCLNWMSRHSRRRR